MYKKVKEYLGRDWEAYRKAFESALESRSDLLNKINGYLFSRPGKQLRPMFSLLTAKACCESGFCSESAISCAAACEMLHTATLLHDDVVDNADTRRGAPTVKSIASSTASVLIGDYWLSKVVEVIVHNCNQRVILYYSKCLQDLAEGEMLQLEKAQNLDTTEEDYFAIIYRKTASLFETSIKSAAYVSNASEEVIAAFEQYAYHVGLAFQIMDDIFDYSPNLSTGKPAGLDVLERKITLPLLGAFANSSAEEVSRIKVLMGKIGSAVGQDADCEATCAAGAASSGSAANYATCDELRGDAHDKAIAAQIVAFVHENGGIEYSQQRLQKEISLAVESLSILPPSQSKDYLISLAEYLLSRQQ